MIDFLSCAKSLEAKRTTDPPEWDLYSSHHMSKWHRCSTRPRPAMGCHLRHSCLMKYSSLPETNIAPENGPKGNNYSNHPFSGAMFFSGRVTHTKSIKICLNAAVPQKRKISISCIFIGSWCKWKPLKKKHLPPHRPQKRPQSSWWEMPKAPVELNSKEDTFKEQRSTKSHIWGFPKMVGFPNNHGFSY